MLIYVKFIHNLTRSYSFSLRVCRLCICRWQANAQYDRQRLRSAVLIRLQTVVKKQKKPWSKAIETRISIVPLPIWISIFPFNLFFSINP